MATATEARPFVDWPTEKIVSAITSLDAAIEVANRAEDWDAVVAIGATLGNLYHELNLR